MIILDTTTKSLEILLGGAVATNQLPFTASYVDVLSSDQSVSALVEDDGQSNNSTAVTVVAAPASGHTRTIKFVTVRNADTASVTLIIRINNNGTFRELWKGILAVDDTFIFGDEVVGIPGGSTSSLPDPVTVPHGGTGLVTLTAHGVLIGEGTANVAITGTGTAGQVLTSNGASSDPTFQSITPVGATTTSTGTVNDFAPAGITFVSGQVTVLRCNNATLLTINGIAGGVDGATLQIESIGAGEVDFAHQNTGSLAGNRLINFVTSGITPLAAGKGMARYIYDGTTLRWRLTHHEQGGFINIAYAAGNFTASGGGTWTVDAGDQETLAFLVSGAICTMVWVLSTTTVAGGPIALQIKLPNSYSAAKTLYSTCVNSDNGTSAAGKCQVAAGTLVFIYRDATGTAWSASTNNTLTEGEFFFDLT